MPQRCILCSLIVICLTILLFTWMVRDSLCELHIRQGNNELAAFLACEVKQ
ncbi:MULTISPECIES: type I toxin-antitoxin system toxin HokA [Citrobacter]|uniref:Type I toxin-antitoxin system toxin HokA n=1 Tax=Citrobacter sedlakii TaxID=67826 RepID=A0ABS0ZTI4_9ENTR|nr:MULTISPECIES: type I toxin-antitoxin system toxin HokA [Citrobacter]EHG7581101.1 type I toxin-antitoxin system toxin HokA [Citrobacter sedlakii]EHG7611291.1 type I toxin-antitoxin system toxin HokA [Citrobacter sedlakii]EIQ7157402.1 type I toxin-antitoxin system toxin HokA [Citrobacter sedlakii]EKJ8219760.1 type I toxin-antitoxin system toxin HokA [Citrobacter sedlakii]EKX8503947.1 type I toxin-antitoxin system toxin HokA [Citrobacter sedlakii]